MQASSPRSALTVQGGMDASAPSQRTAGDLLVQYQSGLYAGNNNSSSPLSSHGNSPIVCERCGEVCCGEVVRVKDTHFHVHCFTCQVCSCDLVHSGFFHHSGEYICTEDYQRLYGTQCDSCDQYITGEVVSALGRTYHPHCFVCSLCRDGIPYCETDYHAQFGIRCEGCNRYISGRVLEAGGKHYHPSCARCARCHMMFLEGQEMYLAGSEVWHPMCKEAARLERKLRLRRTSETASVSPPGSSPLLGSPHRLICQLAALPRVKAIYGIQRPDIIPYQADHAHTHLSEDTLERYSYGQDLLDGVELKTRRSSSSAFTESPAQSRHGGSPLHYYLPGSESGRSSPCYSQPEPRCTTPTTTTLHVPKHFHVPASVETNIYRKPPIYKRQAQVSGAGPHLDHASSGIHINTNLTGILPHSQSLLVSSGHDRAARPQRPGVPAALSGEDTGLTGSSTQTPLNDIPPTPGSSRADNSRRYRRNHSSSFNSSSIRLSSHLQTEPNIRD
ncbi:hypothetical protein PAMA_006233 [Pampus argenteus]